MDFMNIEETVRNAIQVILGYAWVVTQYLLVFASSAWSVFKVLLVLYVVWVVAVAVLCLVMSRKKELVLTISNPILRTYDIQDKYFNYPYHDCSVIPPGDTWELCRGLWKFPMAIIPIFVVWVWVEILMGWYWLTDAVSQRIRSKKILYNRDDD